MQTAVLSGVTEANPFRLGKGIYLVLLHATRIPPHIGMLFDGTYHSLTVKGKDSDVPFQALTRNILLRKLPSLFLEIKTGSAHSAAEMSGIFKDLLAPYNRVEAGQATCLSPVKQFFTEVSGIPAENVSYVYELIPLLQARGLAGAASGFFLEEKLESGSYRFPWYTMQEIDSGIRQVRTEFN